MYELLSESDKLQGGDVFVYVDGDEMEVNGDGGWVGELVHTASGWAGDNYHPFDDEFDTPPCLVAVLRPVK